MSQTLTLELPEAVARGLQARAAHQNVSVESVAALFLAERLEADAADFDPATIAAIREGIADGEAGREQPFEEYVAEMQARRAARRMNAAR